MPLVRQAITSDFHQEYLDCLAVFATATANTSIADINARRCVSETGRRLVVDGQLTNVSAQPDTLLDTLVSNHLLMRSGDTPGYSFQHQQFQEWYASHYVERLMLQASTDPAVLEQLKSEVLNLRPWTEAILFAVERTARGNSNHKMACSTAILSTLEVDPILAADMIFRATNDVWAQITTTVQRFVSRWHTPGKVDRAVRFMITSGRSEFFELLWPLLTHESDQVRIVALRAGSNFRPSVLGSDAADLIAGLPLEVRKNVLNGIVLNSGMDGLDLATAVAKKDSDPEVKALVVDALSFQRADRHIVDLLDDANEETFDILAREGYIDYIDNPAVQKSLDLQNPKL